MSTKKLLWTVIPVVLMVIGATNAKADTFYTINFSSSYGDPITPSGALPTSGIVDYNATANTITATIVWEGQTFVFNTSDLTDGSVLYNVSCGSPAANQAAIALNMLNGCTGYVWWYANVNPPGGPYYPYGSTSGENYFSLDAGVFPDLQTTVTDGASNSFTAQGNLTITQSTAEPGVLPLTLLGVGLVGLMFIMRKRLGLRLDQAT
jgi:hypothetical protein